MQPHLNPADLSRFVAAQEGSYAAALAELRAGKKRTHWVWYVLPQLRGLGSSHMSNFYGIASLAEARAYMLHPILGARLSECVRAINSHRGSAIEQVLGVVDAAKYRSCLTLFKEVEGGTSLFTQALNDCFGGRVDLRTVELLGGHRPQSSGLQC